MDPQTRETSLQVFFGQTMNLTDFVSCVLTRKSMELAVPSGRSATGSSREWGKEGLFGLTTSVHTMNPGHLKRQIELGKMGTPKTNALYDGLYTNNRVIC